MATNLYDMLYGNGDPLFGSQPTPSPLAAPAPAPNPVPPVYAQPGVAPAPAPQPAPVNGIEQPSQMPMLKLAPDAAPPQVDTTPSLSPTASEWLKSTPDTQPPVQWHAPIAGYPTGMFDRPVDPSTGTPYTKDTWNAHIQSDPNAADNTWANRHTDLRRGLYTLFAGMREFAGDRMGKPGMGQQMIEPMLAQDEQQRQWLANRPAMQQAADLNAQKEQSEADLKTAQAGYFGAGGPMQGQALRQGYVVDPITRQLVPIQNLSQVQQATVDKSNAVLANSGLKRDENGNIVPETDRSKLPLPVQAKMELQDAQEEAAQAKADLDRSKNDPNSPSYKLALAKYQQSQQRLSLAYQNSDRAQRKFMVDTYGVDPGMTIAGGGGHLPVSSAPAGGSTPVSAPAAGHGAAPAPVASGTTAPSAPKGVPTNADGTAMTPNSPMQKTFDKSYVVPAQGVEKSYQMMNNAFNEYTQAKAQGKDLPTGAQSMVALSTHLSTTFGNVKGARVTKDMIQEHLGARSVSDSALVAMQKLTNGDVLSPAQWTAFHDLIQQSRNITWDQAAKEAGRKHLPIDFLPSDLQSKYAQPKSSNGGALPPGWK